MTQSEFRKKIVLSENSDWFESLETTFSIPFLNISINLKGITSVYEFLVTQSSEWSKKGENLPSELQESKNAFDACKNDLLALAEQDIYNRSATWNRIKAVLESPYKKYFLAELPEVEFLLNVNAEFPQSYVAALNFITNSINNPVGSKENFIGSLLAYEFSLKDHTKITERKNAEKASISKIRNQFADYLNITEKETIGIIKQTNNEFIKYTTSIDDLKVEKNIEFEDWFTNTKDQNDQFDNDAKAKIKSLEDAYDKLLMLKKPAEYWNDRAVKLNKEGKRFMHWLIAMVGFGCLSLFLILWLTPDGILLNFKDQPLKSIKWSIVYITFISFLAFGIKVLSKAMFSSYHLSRDSEEREQLTYVYLALIKEGAADEKDRILIMQSLFSRADTGLLKEDSSPSMPGLAEKLIK